MKCKMVRKNTDIDVELFLTAILNPSDDLRCHRSIADSWPPEKEHK